MDNNNTQVVEAVATEVGAKPAQQNQQLIKPKENFDIDGFILKRQEFIQKVNAICVEGKDYHVIQGKKSLAKGGAEKIAAIFGWTAKFAKDQETYDMLSKSFPNDALVAYYCWLTKPMDDQFHTLGQGRGAALLSKNAKDPNKTIKMAQKSAFIDAVLRASGLSDFFTQDLEDMGNVETNHPQRQQQQNQQPKKVEAMDLPTDKQMGLIKNLKEQKGYSSRDVAIALGFKAGDIFGRKQASKVIDWLTKAPRMQPAAVPVDDLGWPTEQQNPNQ